MQTVFDAPVPTPVAKQKRRVGLVAGKTADSVLDFDRGPTLTMGRAFQSANLGQAGPIEMSSQPRAGLQVAMNDAAVTLAAGAGLR
jgi:hypothetical protein